MWQRQQGLKTRRRKNFWRLRWYGIIVTEAHFRKEVGKAAAETADRTLAMRNAGRSRLSNAATTTPATTLSRSRRSKSTRLMPIHLLVALSVIGSHIHPCAFSREITALSQSK